MKFRYLDEVKIISGFYRGYKGIIVGTSRNKYGTLFYNVEIKVTFPQTGKKRIEEVQVKEKELTKIEK